MSALWLAMLAGGLSGEPLAWTDLAPWRTWVVIDDISTARHWFVLDRTPGVGTRCEVGVPVDRRALGGTVVHCGEPSVSDAGRQPLPRNLRGQEKRARKALDFIAGDAASRLSSVQMDYLATYQRVSFRQVVVTAARPEPSATVTWTHASFWDVEVDTGRVDHGVLGIRVGQEPLCLSGMHAHCDDAPKLLPFVPSGGWEGHLIDTEADRIQAAQTRQLEDLIRAAVRGEEGSFGAPVRAVGESLLPSTMQAGASLRLDLRVQSATGATSQREVVLDFPMNEAAFAGSEVSFRVEGTDATVFVGATFGEQGQLHLRVEGGDAPAKERFMPVQCDVVRDGARAVLAAACRLDVLERTLTWVGAGGVQRLTVTTADSLLPLLGPSRGPEAR